MRRLFDIEGEQGKQMGRVDGDCMIPESRAPRSLLFSLPVWCYGYSYVTFTYFSRGCCIDTAADSSSTYISKQRVAERRGLD